MRRLIVAGLMLASAGALGAQEAAPSKPGPTFVFFDWSKPELSGDAKAILEEVAAAHRQNPGARLTLAGHADRSGGAAVNRRSALQRAASVAAYLEARGVPRHAMTVESHGEDRPIVATEDGVREAQNRRVEIVFGPEN